MSDLYKVFWTVERTERHKTAPVYICVHCLTSAVNYQPANYMMFQIIIVLIPIVKGFLQCRFVVLGFSLDIRGV